MDVNEALRVGNTCSTLGQEYVCYPRAELWQAVQVLAAEVQRLQRDAKADKQVIDTLGADVTRLEQANAELQRDVRHVAGICASHCDILREAIEATLLDILREAEASDGK